MGGIRDRIKELRRVRAGDLRANPRNWRTHPPEQVAAMRGILADVGYADAVLARELSDGSLELIDGHLRQTLDDEQVLPVLVLDLDEAEAQKLMASLDPLAAMAEADEILLGRLLSEVTTDDDGLRAMLDDLAAANGIDLDPAPTEAAFSRNHDAASPAPSLPPVTCPRCGAEFVPDED